MFMKKVDIEILSGSKKPMMIFGLIFIALGLLAILLPVAASVTIELFVGVLFILGGISGLLMALQRYQGSTWWLHAVFGLISVALGMSFIFNPTSGLISLTLILVFIFAIEGALTVNWAMQLRDKSRKWFWMLFSGITPLVLATIVLAGLPHTATWIIGFLIGINFLTTGISFITLATAIDK